MSRPTLVLSLVIWSVFVLENQGHRHHIAEIIADHKELKHGFTPAPSTTSRPVDKPCARGVHCVPPIQCPAHFHDGKPIHCHVTGGRVGICCTTGQNHTGLSIKKARSNVVTIPKDVLNSAAKISRVEITELLDRESRLLMSGRSTTVPEGSASYSHFRNSRFSDPAEMSKAFGIANRALEMVTASRTVKNKQRFSNEQYEFGMIQSNLHDTPLGAACMPPPMCAHPTNRYATLDGTCNNLINGGWGSMLTPYARLLPPVYDDGVWSPRVSKTHGQPLPSTRLISSSLFYDLDRPDEEHTLMLMTFGQFLSHDFTRAMEIKYPNGSGISCCTSDNSREIPADWRHYGCMPISVSHHDPFYKGYKIGCLNFVRSLLAPRDDCSLGYAQQMNKVSHFIDGSGIYGTDHVKLDELREYEGGRLRMFKDFGRDLLPLTQDPEDCLTMEHGSACFSAGDGRSNQMISLVAIHTLFAREHNRIAIELSEFNPHWSDEIIFLETRRIVVAELLHITYSQWLPEVIGQSAMHEFGLNVDIQGYSSDYDQYMNPSVTNEFATAAFRFGHSIVDGKMKIYGYNKMEEIIDIPDIMFSPAKMRKREFFDEILTTMTVDCIQSADTSFADALTKYLFRAGNPFGLDLVAINIQRGRDHGLRSYNDYRELVGLPRFDSFEDFGHEAGFILHKVYASVDDVDLYVGGLLEPRAPGAIVGVTFREMIADQFARFKNGDRYFYNLHPNINPGHFSRDQLKELKKSSLSRIICDNSDNIMLARQAVNSFRKPGINGNELYDCSSSMIPKMDLSYWKHTI